jgi:hypothetical protein
MVSLTRKNARDDIYPGGTECLCASTGFLAGIVE